jgi:hypothetical protein
MALSNLDAAPAADGNGIGPLLLFARGFLQRQYRILLVSALLALAVANRFARQFNSS